MDLIRFGRSIRALRIRRRWRQKDLAAAAHLSPTKIARIERGLGRSMPIRDLDQAANALGATIDLRLNWNGEALDRLLDGAHARIVDVVAAQLRALGWEVVLEATFFIRGERGSIDILAWHAASRVVLVIEVKSVVADIQAMLASLDRKLRLGMEIAHGRGWSPVAVARLLVVGDSRTSRRRVEAVSATFAAEFPQRAIEVRRWLASPTPTAPLRGLWFLSASHGVTVRHRVRCS
jgi:transcriptional regulator with XRE-family HTH domain